MAQLFPKDAVPKAKRVRRMHVADAGHLPGGVRGIRFLCPWCGHDSGWIQDDRTVTQNKRGLPCPNCNKGA